VPFSEALFRGLAPDGGLYVPAETPRLPPAAILGGDSFRETALLIARALLGGSVSEDLLVDVIDEALDFPVPVVPLGDDLFVLELFHGPTLAFKDVGARFMAALMERLDPEPDRRRVVLVATSGDTGSAVAHAFAGRDRFQVIVLFPAGKVSDVQRRLFTTLHGNVVAAAVHGDFDDCQRLAKEAFRAPDAERFRLTSANSINAGRLVPQSFYYAEAVRVGGWLQEGCVFSVPSGNFGNLTGGLLAERLGLPVRRFIAATNANDGFHRYLVEGAFRPIDTRHTLSNAMDVGDPSNRERIDVLFEGDVERMRQSIWTSSFSDSATLECMGRVRKTRGYLLDPHTAVGFLGAEAYRVHHGADEPIVILSTAHPAKFPEVVERATGRRADPPDRLRAALEGDERWVDLDPELGALTSLLRDVGAGEEMKT
jgi:threonine synthase